MFKKGVVLLIVLGLMFSAAAVYAIDPEEKESNVEAFHTEFGDMMRYTDGRLNEWDLIAPVAVYYTRAMVPKTDANGELLLLPDGRKDYVSQVVSLDLWGLSPTGPEGSIDHLINIPIAELNAMVAAATEPIELASAFGYQVGYSPDFGGWFWVSAPPDAEGNVYVFHWQ